MENQISEQSIKTGFSTFGLIWLGQTISLLGSGLTSFALGIWVYQTTGGVTSYALIALFIVVPTLLLSSVSGAVVDRWNYRNMMLASDAASALITLLIAGLFYTGRLELWHIYLSVAANACFATFQQPAYIALISKLVSSEQLGRASGMVQMGLAVSDLFAPLLAGILVVQISVAGVILIDFSTFLVAVATLLLVNIPSQAKPAQALQNTNWDIPALLNETRLGWRYIAVRRGLLGLMAYLAIANFAAAVINSILVPMLLNITTTETIGIIISIAGGGMFAGSLVMSVWGGPKRRMQTVLASELIKGFGIILIGLRPAAWLVAIGATLAHFAIPFSAASNQAIWQMKIPQEIQGRVFAIRQIVTRSIMPLAYLLVGPLADHVFEPLMRSPHGLFQAVGLVVGTGTGRGMGLLFSLMGLVIAATATLGALIPAIRSVEEA
ncbi:MAG TPA: MFS transporter [Anaerolineales bacterium]|nr:MFS transporter [Anaerolineales bacterium]HLO28839.1 MFS transporter [Anaerolineales bacterium]